MSDDLSRDVSQDLDPAETHEWLEALDSVLAFEGADRAFQLLDEVIAEARRKGAAVPYSATTPYLNTIPPGQAGPRTRGDRGHRAPHPLAHPLERDGDGGAGQQEVRRARRPHRELPLGGHALRRRLQPLLARADRRPTAATCSTSRATPRRASTRASFLEGRLTEEQLVNFRLEVDGGGLSSYPHPWLMPDYWQFPTVSMGLGPIMAIYQARFLQVPEQPRPGRHRPTARSGLPRRRRDRRARVAGRDLAGRRARSSTT